MFRYLSFDLRFYSETNRAKLDIQLRRLEAEDTLWLKAFSKEQLTLVTNNWFHWWLLSLGVMFTAPSRQTTELMPRRFFTVLKQD